MYLLFAPETSCSLVQNSKTTRCWTIPTMFKTWKAKEECTYSLPRRHRAHWYRIRRPQGVGPFLRCSKRGRQKKNVLTLCPGDIVLTGTEFEDHKVLDHSYDVQNVEGKRRMYLLFAPETSCSLVQNSKTT